MHENGATNPSPTSRQGAPGRIVFEAHDLAKVYLMGTVEVPALRDASLDVRDGEFIVVLGPSGSGKSTLLNILGGLDVPSSGSLRFLDHGLTRANDAGKLAPCLEIGNWRRIFHFPNTAPECFSKARFQSTRRSKAGVAHSMVARPNRTATS